ncbi:hypothetical protein ACFL3D_03735 [Candidatus Omnitrophota bacterium]
MKKIIFIEPYATLGGHPLRNVTTIPTALQGCKDIGYEFVVEKDLSINVRHKVKRCLHCAASLRSLPLESAVQKRVEEFQNIIYRYKQGTFIFLSMYEEDFLAWCALVKDVQFVRYITERDLLIIVHSASGVYEHLMLEKDELAKNYYPLRKQLYFSFFTEELADLASSLCEQLRCVSLIHPAYDSTYKALTLTRNTGKHISFVGVGFGEALKNPRVVIDAIEKNHTEQFQIHINKVDKKNVLPCSYLTSRNYSNVTLVRGDVSQKRYWQMIRQSKIGIIPYDSYEYAIRASGILEDFLLGGVPVVVPKDSWLEKLMQQCGNAGLSFDEEKEDDFDKQLKLLLHDYPLYKERAKKAREYLFEKLSVRNYVERLTDFIDFRNITTMSFYSGSDSESIRSKNFTKGKVFYLTKVAQRMREMGEVACADDCNREAVEYDSCYWRNALSICEDSFCGKDVNKLPVDKIVKGDFSKNPSYCASLLIEIIRDGVSIDAKLKQMIEQYVRQIYYYLSFDQLAFFLSHGYGDCLYSIFLSLLNKVKLPIDMLISFGTLYFNAKEYKDANIFFSRALRSLDKNNEENLIAEANVFIKKGQTERELGRGRVAEQYFSKAHKKLKAVKKNDADILYNIGLIFKEACMFEEALKWFFRAKKKENGTSLAARIAFHICDILMQKRKFKQARPYIEYVLQHNPCHHEARAHAMSLTI